MSIPLSWYLILAAALVLHRLVRRAFAQECHRHPAGCGTDAECRQYQPGGFLALPGPGTRWPGRFLRLSFLPWLLRKWLWVWH